MYMHTKSKSQHMLPVTPHVPESSVFSKDPDAHHDPLIPTQMHSQFNPVSISGFDCTSAKEPSDFRLWQPKACHFRFQQQRTVSDFRVELGIESKLGGSISDFRFQTRTRWVFEIHGFNLRFQISDSGQGDKSKARVSFRFQVSISREAPKRN